MNHHMSETTKLKTTFWGKNWISLIALILSIISLCFSGFRMEPVTFGIDRYNFSIDVLSLLVTLLIGWQVINVISFEKRMKKIVDNETSKLKNEIDTFKIKSEGLIFLTIGIAFYETFPLKAYMNYIWAIMCFLDADDFNDCYVCLINMEVILKEKERYFINNDCSEYDLEGAILAIKNHPKYATIKFRFENIEANRENIFNKNIRK